MRATNPQAHTPWRDTFLADCSSKIPDTNQEVADIVVSDWLEADAYAA
jgi:hypothetical protein